MLRQNTSFKLSDRSGNLRRPVTKLWGLNESLWRQQRNTEDDDKAAVEPVMRSLKAAAEDFVGNPICFLKVVVSGNENNEDYLYHIIARALRQAGLIEVWAERPRVPTLALVSKWLDEGDFGQPEGLTLNIDNSEYGFHLDLLYQHDGLTNILRHNYHRYTGTENATDRAPLLRQAFMEIIGKPVDYKSYGNTVPQVIRGLVIYGDSIWDPGFKNSLDATLDSRLIQGAY